MELIYGALSIALFAVKAFALFDVLRRDAAIIDLRSPLQKTPWLVILSVSLVAHMISQFPLSLFNLIGTVASLVYLAQVRSEETYW